MSSRVMAAAWVALGEDRVNELLAADYKLNKELAEREQKEKEENKEDK